jgi:hypothetical protein
MEEFEYNGIWWLPEEPDKEIHGILKFHPIKGANLELSGSFKELKSGAVRPEDLHLDPDIILGSTSNGEITLYKCVQNTCQFVISRPEASSSSFAARVVFVGPCFEQEEDIVFDSIALSYPYLEEWTGISGFQAKLYYVQERSRQIDIVYSHPQEVEIEIDDLSISFDYELSVSNLLPVIKEANLKQTTFIEIEPRERRHFDDYLNDICYHVQNFLSLAIGIPVYPVIIKGKTEACRWELSDGRTVYKDILIFYQVRSLSDLPEKIGSSDMLFPFEDISGDFESCLRNWFRKSEILGPVYDLYFGTVYNPSMYLQHQFLSLIQAIESYHRRTHGGKYLSDDDYEKVSGTLVEAIPQDVDRDFSESLRQRLKYHNEFSLRRRLKEILREYGKVADLLIHDRKGFADDVVNTRNFLTHYDRDLETKAKSGEELFRLVQKMKFMLEICLLTELEIPMEKIKTLMSRNRRYQFLAKSLKK